MRLPVSVAISFLVTLSSLPAATDAQLRARLSPDLLGRMGKGGAPVSAVVLLWNQEVTNPRLGLSPFEKNENGYLAESDRSVDKVISDAGLDRAVRHRFRSFPGFSATLTPGEIERLAEHSYVRAVIPDVPARLHRVEGNALMNVPAARGRGATGAGVTVAVIDDGVDYKHPELGGPSFPNSVVVGGFDFVLNITDPGPDLDPSTGQLETHGTSVAGIIAGRGDSQTGGSGVAPQAKIVGLRIRSFADVVKALDWVVMNRTSVNPPIGVVNMSLGFDDLGFFSSTCDSQTNALPYTEVVARLVQVGIVTVASTGNENKLNTTSIPSCLSNVISAGAVYDGSLGGLTFSNCADGSTVADAVTCYSNAASFVTLLAPSHNARTPKAGGGYFAEFGGTSAASPYIAGAVALLKGSFPGRSPAQYRDVLRSTGRLIVDPKSGFSTPRVDVDRALAALGGNSGGPKNNIYFVPAAARFAGSGGSFFQSDARIYNKGTETASIDVFLLNSDSNPSPASASITVPARQAIPVDDIILNLFRIQAGGGALRFASDQPLEVTSNLYTTNAVCPDKGGTFGQFIPGYTPSQAGTNQRIYHVIHNAAFRSNIGVVNTTGGNANVIITIKDGDGRVLGAGTKTLGPFGWSQFNAIFGQLGAPPSANAIAEVTSDAPVLSYLSVLDNRTSDPFFAAGKNE